jgi:hypothetical protein
MSHHPRFDPMPPAASGAALDLALRPFAERFVQPDRREKALALLGKPRPDWRELGRYVDPRRGRPYQPADLGEWKAVTGVFLVEHDAFSLDASAALALYVPGEKLFVSYGATFALLHDATGGSLLLT